MTSDFRSVGLEPRTQHTISGAQALSVHFWGLVFASKHGARRRRFTIIHILLHVGVDIFYFDMDTWGRKVAERSGAALLKPLLHFNEVFPEESFADIAFAGPR